MAGKKENKKMSSDGLPPIANRIVALAKAIREKRTALLTERDLLPGHDDFLIEIAKAPGIAMGDLAAALKISPSSTTKIATRLEALNLMRRETSRIDNRQNHAFLTEAGEALVIEIHADRASMDEDFAKLLKGKDGERLIKIFDRLEGRKDPVGKKPRQAGKMAGKLTSKKAGKKPERKNDKKAEKKAGKSKKSNKDSG